MPTSYLVTLLPVQGILRKIINFQSLPFVHFSIILEHNLTNNYILIFVSLALITGF